MKIYSLSIFGVAHSLTPKFFFINILNCSLAHTNIFLFSIFEVAHSLTQRKSCTFSELLTRPHQSFSCILLEMLTGSHAHMMIFPCPFLELLSCSHQENLVNFCSCSLVHTMKIFYIFKFANSLHQYFLCTGSSQIVLILGQTETVPLEKLY